MRHTISSKSKINTEVRSARVRNIKASRSPPVNEKESGGQEVNGKEVIIERLGEEDGSAILNSAQVKQQDVS